MKTKQLLTLLIAMLLGVTTYAGNGNNETIIKTPRIITIQPNPNVSELPIITCKETARYYVLPSDSEPKWCVDVTCTDGTNTMSGTTCVSLDKISSNSYSTNPSAFDIDVTDGSPNPSVLVVTETQSITIRETTFVIRAGNYAVIDGKLKALVSQTSN